MTPERIGPYRILEKIGSGGMGHVYLAEHDDGAGHDEGGERDEGSRRVAVKVLTASLAREGGFVERFNREIDAMRKLDNPHIVKLFDSGVDGESYWYAMEFVAGETLLGVMHREKRVPWRKAIEIAVQVCQALKSAHNAGIIHRDLKPSNLLVTADGQIKLTDFGVAQVFAGSRLTVTGGIIGTAEYMSPEQAQGKRATKQSDLYSLGALLYAMITGRTPFSGSTAVEVIQKHRFGLFDRPSLFVPDLPQRVEETITRLLEKDPAKRFPDALVLLRHLEQLTRLEDFAHGGVTLAEASSVRCDDPTVAVTTSAFAPKSNEPAHPGPATLMQGLLRAEIEEMNRKHWFAALFDSLLVQVTLLALVVGGGVWWFWPKAVPPQERFDRGVALMEHQPGPDWLQARREFFEPLVAADPEAWREKAAPYLERIEIYELTRGSRGGKRGKPSSAESEPQRIVQLALHYRDAGDFGRAERTLESLRALLAGNGEEAKTYELAGRLLEEVRKERGSAPDRDRLLRESLARADKLAEEGKPAEAREIWKGLISLYADEPGADRFVEQAREALAGEERRLRIEDRR